MTRLNKIILSALLGVFLLPQGFVLASGLCYEASYFGQTGANGIYYESGETYNDVPIYTNGIFVESEWIATGGATYNILGGNSVDSHSDNGRLSSGAIINGVLPTYNIYYSPNYTGDLAATSWTNNGLTSPAGTFALISCPPPEEGGSTTSATSTLGWFWNNATSTAPNQNDILTNPSDYIMAFAASIIIFFITFFVTLKS